MSWDLKNEENMVDIGEYGLRVFYLEELLVFKYIRGNYYGYLALKFNDDIFKGIICFF